MDDTLLWPPGYVLRWGKFLAVQMLVKNRNNPWMLNQIGGWGMGLIVPLISAAIAYSIADRPGFARA